MNTDDTNPRPRGSALLPLGLFFALYLVTFAFTGDLSRMPVVIAFLLTAVAAVCFSKGSVSQRVGVFCRGAANETILLMVVIFILAGAFAGSAKAMGAVDATVQIALQILPQNMIPAGLFLAACFVSMSMGTSCGTIAALTPIAVGLSPQIGMSLPAMIGIVVGGAMFGDNLSFISDTTIVATRTQGVRMRDKFIVNLRIVLPAALLATLLYVWQGLGLRQGMTEGAELSWVRMIPYVVVLVAAMAGVNVMTVLLSGFFLCGLIGLADGGFTVWEWAKATHGGIVGDMGELIIVSLMAGGLFEVIRRNGGVEWLVRKLTRSIQSRRKAEGSLAVLTMLTNLCTANNTIALIIVGPIARKIGDEYRIDGRRTASLLDTFSCFTQGMIPYGAQLLIASGLAGGVGPAEIVPYLYYPFLIGLASIAAILFQYPRRYTGSVGR
ncbi:MAG: Na+/H+ antiporter NhaC family protein [Tannerellaceae bacterium]|jgi:Na+/H+ antiporter NhaC|nr:Na+/H+ antiporter NhaC family protein [Tannerellaceae bacterium]